MTSTERTETQDVAALAADVLAKHQKAEWGMGYGSPDRCTCGTETRPLPGDEEVTIRRNRAFAAHQAEMTAPVLAQAVLDRDAEIARLRAEAGLRGSIEGIVRSTALSPSEAARVIRDVADLRGASVERARAEAAEGRLSQVEALVDEWGRGSQPSLNGLRRALADPDPADPTQPAERETCPPHDAQYARSECGGCGEQESWCSRCTEQLCGCQPAEREGGA